MAVGKTVPQPAIRRVLLDICGLGPHGLGFGVIRSRPLVSAEGRRAGVDQVASGGHHRTRREDVEGAAHPTRTPASDDVISLARSNAW